MKTSPGVTSCKPIHTVEVSRGVGILNWVGVPSPPLSFFSLEEKILNKIQEAMEVFVLSLYIKIESKIDSFIHMPSKYVY